MRFLTPITVYVPTVLVIVFAMLSELFSFSYGGGFGESSAATIFSMVLLGATALVCFGTAYTRAGQNDDNARRAAILWIVVGVAFIVLALDEGFMIHENLDQLFHRIAEISETAWTDRIDDFILLVYGLIGLLILFRFRAEFLGTPRARKYFAAAFVLFFISFVLDALTNRREYLDWLGLTGQARQIVHYVAHSIEEIAKLLSGATLLLAFSFASVSVKHREVEPMTQTHQSGLI